MTLTNPLDTLLELLARLPGIGPRSARRLLLQLLKKQATLLRPLGEALLRVAETVQTCKVCGAVDTVSPCRICSNPQRDQSVICVVETLADLWALERTTVYKGLYHVLGGTLSAQDGVDPHDLKIDRLLQRAGNGVVREVIIATNATLEGQLTAHYITDRLQDSAITVTRLAQGLPMGGELDYLDDGTLATALGARRQF